MLLLLRCAKIMFFALLAKKPDLLAELRLPMRVWPNDCDLNFHLNDGRYVSMAGLGRVDFLTRTGLLREAYKRGWMPVVGAVTIRYRRSLQPFERFTLITRIVAWDEKWLYIEHRFERLDGTTAALAYVRGVLRDKKGAIPIAEVLTILGRHDVSPPIPEAIAKWNEAQL